MKITRRIDIWFLQYIRALRLRLAHEHFAHIMTVDKCPSSTEGAEDQITIFAAADSVYLERFLKPFLGSMVAHNSTSRLHIHLYNPKDSSFDLLKENQHQYPTVKLSWSHETFSSEDFESHAPNYSNRFWTSPYRQSWKSLYICTSRFLAARTIQEQTGGSLLIVDIDILFNGNIRQKFGHQKGISLLFRPHDKNLSKRTLGGVVFVSAGRVGRQFLATTCDYIERFLNAGFYWFAFDQYALDQSIQVMAPEVKQAYFDELTERDVSFEFDPDALIIFPKGKTKNEDTFANLGKKYTT